MPKVIKPFDYKNLTGKDPASTTLVKAFVQHKADVASIESEGKIKRTSGVAYKELALAMADSQQVILRIKDTGDVFQVLVNNKVVPIKNQDNISKAVIEIVDRLDAGRAAFQKALLRKKIEAPVPKGIKTAAANMIPALQERIPALKAEIEAVRSERLAIEAEIAKAGENQNPIKNENADVAPSGAENVANETGESNKKANEATTIPQNDAPEQPKPVELPYTFANATESALRLFRIAAGDKSKRNAFVSAKAVEEALKPVAVHWDATDELPDEWSEETLDAVGLFGDELEGGYIRGSIKDARGAEIASVTIRGDGDVMFIPSQGHPEEEQFDPDEMELGRWVSSDDSDAEHIVETVKSSVDNTIDESFIKAYLEAFNEGWHNISSALYFKEDDNSELNLAKIMGDKKALVVLEGDFASKKINVINAAIKLADDNINNKKKEALDAGFNPNGSHIKSVDESIASEVYIDEVNEAKEMIKSLSRKVALAAKAKAKEDKNKTKSAVDGDKSLSDAIAAVTDERDVLREIADRSKTLKLHKFAEATNNELFDADYKGGEWVAESEETTETFDDFIESSKHWNERTGRDSGEIAGFKFIAWERMQSRKGKPRQSLSVIDFGDVRFALPGTFLPNYQ